jgi:anti-anti-sigma regulatory factor
VSVPIVLPARLDSAAAVQLAATLRDRVGTDVLLDASGVDLLGAKALQTLLVAAGAWRAAGHAFSVADLRTEVRGQIATLGLSNLSQIEGSAP